MIGGAIVFATFGWSCVAAIFRPWIGIVALYGFILLDPGWNWRWAIDRAFSFQFYLAIFILAGWTLSGFAGLDRIRHLKFGVGCLWGFLLLAFVSSAQTINPDLTSFYLKNMWKIVLITTIAIAVIDEPRKIGLLIFVAVICQGYNAFQINLQYFQDGYSAFASEGWLGGAMGDNNTYSIFTISIFAMAIAIALTTRLSNWLKCLALGIASLQLHQFMLLESRGGMLGIGLLVGMAAILAAKSVSNVVGFSVVTIIAVLLAGPPVVKEFSSIFNKAEKLDNSADSRFKLWKAGAEITADYPLLGVGPWSGSMMVPKYYDGELGVNRNRKELHNLVFETTTGCGVPAAILYFLFFLIPWYGCVIGSWRGEYEDPQLICAGLAVAIGLPGYMLASMFSSGALLETSYLLAAIGYATQLSAEPNARENDDISVDTTESDLD